jgi:hypothetical protein
MKAFSKFGPTTILRGAVVAIGLVILALCTWVIPFAIVSIDTGPYLPLLIGLYIPAVPFYYALYQAMKLLQYIDKNKAFSELSVAALRSIKVCALLICGLFLAGSPYNYYLAERDDAPGVLLFALIIVFASFTIATFAGLLQKLMQNGLDLKAENDLTV